MSGQEQTRSLIKRVIDELLGLLDEPAKAEEKDEPEKAEETKPLVGADGDAWLRSMGIVLDCERDVMFFHIYEGKCGRPFGHTGGHRAAGHDHDRLLMARNELDEKRTNETLRTIMETHRG